MKDIRDSLAISVASFHCTIVAPFKKGGYHSDLRADFVGMGGEEKEYTGHHASRG